MQARSHATVGAILEAATYILVRDGWQRFTTKRVAERAGVNIASLYQYFPNKEAIVAELQAWHGEQVRALLPRVLSEIQHERAPGDIFRTIVEAVIQEHRVAPALHRVFAEELPRSARRAAARNDPVRRRWEDAVRPLLKRVPDTELAIFIARAALHAAVHEAAAERPEYLENPQFADELVALLTGYLDRPVSRRTARSRSSVRAERG